MKNFLCLSFLLISLQALAVKTKVVVALDGSGDFTSIQEAVNSFRDFFPNGRAEIYIKNGVYREKVVIPSWKTNITLIGESKEETIIAWSDYSGKGDINTFTSYTVLVKGNDCIIKNLTITNDAPLNSGQAVALHVEGDRFVIKDCKLIGNQDTLFTGIGNSRQYFKDCYIEGTTDFIFGPATVVFDNCHIHCKKNSYITAANTPEEHAYGLVFLGGKVTYAAEADRMYLGRPWRDYAKTVFIRTDLGDHIRPEGWHNWRRPEAEKTSFYAEYKCTGASAERAQRVGWSYELSDAQAANYTLEQIFGGTSPWNPKQLLN